MIQEAEQATERMRTLEEKLDRNHAEQMAALKVLADRIEKFKRFGLQHERDQWSNPRYDGFSTK